MSALLVTHVPPENTHHIFYLKHESDKDSYEYSGVMPTHLPPPIKCNEDWRIW